MNAAEASSLPDRGPSATLLLALLALAKLALHAPAVTQYGYFRDELYYLACAHHLAWGYVDQPPLSIGVLALSTKLLGTSLVALRVVPALAGALTVVIAGLIARELGGGKFAQALAAIGALASPIYLAIDHYYSMNALDLLLWALAAWQLLRALRAGDALKPWLLFGVVVGLGLLNKLSMLWFAGGVGVGLLLTAHRVRLRSLGPWLAALVAGLIFVPHVFWQMQNGWPTREFVHNAVAHKMVKLEIVKFLIDQIVDMNPLSAPVWLAGLVAAFTAVWARGARAFGWIFVAVLAILIANGSARSEYLAPAYPMLLGLGAVAVERASTTRRWMRVAVLALPVVGLAPLLPLSIPILPVERFIAYQKALGLAPATEERHAMGSLPQHYADMFGWQEMAAGVARGFATLTPDERKHCVVYGQNYGEAGAIDFFGSRYGLPRAISGHNSYWFWPPTADEVHVVLIIGGNPEDHARTFDSVEPVATIANPYGMPYERDLTVYACRGIKVPLALAWSRSKHYD
ncbi:MAG TPA: glycosyltransferase family 39 protein [Candidatus Sulfotelmatobacter sp.]|nr:glycosyltransferase family 39 protein [Candidatus Sulfotelmatobacter sp.]